MSKKIWLLFMAAMVIAAVLSACQRSASKAPVPTATSEGALPFPLPATEDTLKIIQTQTALAARTSVAPAPTATPVVAQATTAVPPTLAPTATQFVIATLPTATPGRPTTYTLQQGEWPLCIARRFNLDAADFLALNGLTMDSKPSAGTVLKIPASGTWSYGSRSLIKHPATYTVKSGDTIYSIACAFGDVDPNAIIAANGLKSPYTLTAGQTLQIP